MVDMRKPPAQMRGGLSVHDFFQGAVFIVFDDFKTAAVVAAGKGLWMKRMIEIIVPAIVYDAQGTDIPVNGQNVIDLPIGKPVYPEALADIPNFHLFFTPFSLISNGGTVP